MFVTKPRGIAPGAFSFGKMAAVSRSGLILPLLTVGLLTAIACDRPPARATNVLLITLDTTRADRLGTYGNPDVATPHLDDLAASGALFTSATTSVPLTLPAHASLLTGSTPLRHGVKDNSGFVLADSARTLAEVLRDNGYATEAVVAAYVLHRSRGLDQGFDDYDDRIDDASPGLHSQRNATEIVDLALDRLTRNDKTPQFLWIHFYDPHYPYSPPAEFAARYPERPYDGEIAYVDAQLGRILDHLDRAQMTDNTLIVVAGDHGEAFGEHREVDHGIFLYEPTMRIPLIVRAPGARLDHDVDALVRDIDVMPTILDYLGLPVPQTVQGRSLLPLMAGRDDEEPRLAYGETFYSRYHYGWSELLSIRDRRYKYIRAPAPELYDLDRDPGEQHNVVEVHPGIADDLAATLSEWLAESTAATATPAAMDPEALARLRSLGYAGSTVPVGPGELADPKDHAGSLELFARVGYRASGALRERRYADVLALVDEALRIEPNYLDGYKLAARAHQGLTRHDKAIDLLDRALQISPDDIETLHLLARSHRAGGDSATALALWERVRGISPETPTAYLERAETLIELGRLEQARTELDAARDALGDHARILYESALLRLRRGGLDEASAEIRSALAIEPGLRDAHFNLALIAEQKSDLATAQAEYSAELAVSPAHFEAWTNLGLLSLRGGDPRSASEAFSRLVELRPDAYVGYYLLARAALAAGRTDAEVLELAIKARELDGGSPRTRELVEQVERQLGR